MNPSFFYIVVVNSSVLNPLVVQIYVLANWVNINSVYDFSPARRHAIKT